MAELLLVNPAKRRKARKAKSRRRNPLSPAQIAARNAARAARAAAAPRKRRRKTTKSRRRSRSRVRAVRFTKSQALKYRGKSRRVRRAARVMGKRAAAKRVYGINPINMNTLKTMIAPALVGALGGVVINRTYDKVVEKFGANLPAMITTNAYGSAAAKALLAIGIGMALERVKIVSPQNRNAAIGGALVIIAYDLMDSTILPAIGLAGYQTIDGYQTIEGLGEFEYLDDSDEMDSGDYGMEGLGYINSAETAGVLTGRQFTG